MKNPPFVYHRPASLDAALALLADHGDDAKVLAGGQSLLPTMALRLGPPEQLIDIGRVPGLDTIDVTDGAVTIGLGPGAPTWGLQRSGGLACGAAAQKR